MSRRENENRAIAPAAAAWHIGSMYTRKILVAVAVVTVAIVSLLARQRGRHSPGESASQAHAVLQQHLTAGLDVLHGALRSVDAAVARRDVRAARSAFRLSRKAYKSVEALFAAQAPSAAGVLNGPLPEDDDGPPQPLGLPAAFQRIEANLFVDSMFNGSDAQVRADIALMQKSVAAFRALVPYLALNEANVAEAMRTEVARLTTMSLAGFDSNESGDAVVESAYALAGMQTLARIGGTIFSQKVLWLSLADSLGAASRSLLADSSFDAMNRLRFLSTDVASVGRSLNRVRSVVGGIDDSLRLVWRSRAATVFEPDAFDANAYAPAFAVRPTPQVIALGERLFRDARLSGPGTRSCASCHMAQLAFTDGSARHIAMGGAGKTLSRNTPTLLNIALHPSFFADGRVRTLEDQIQAVLASPLEMSSSSEIAAKRLSADHTYRAEFARVLPLRSESGSDSTPPVTESLLRNVLAAYVRTLVRLDSRFDVAVRGDTLALTSEERHGFTVFMGKGRCGTCHFAPLFSGVIPPAFAMSEAEIIGVPSRADTIGATLDTDFGLAAIDNIALHRGAFNVPTLRNIARTAPYMHNGAYATLEQVVDFYNRGGGAAVGALVPYQTLPKSPLNLSATEQHDLIAFLKSLSDREISR